MLLLLKVPAFPNLKSISIIYWTNRFYWWWPVLQYYYFRMKSIYKFLQSSVTLRFVRLMGTAYTVAISFGGAAGNVINKFMDYKGKPVIAEFKMLMILQTITPGKKIIIRFN